MSKHTLQYLAVAKTFEGSYSKTKLELLTAPQGETVTPASLGFVPSRGLLLHGLQEAGVIWALRMRQRPQKAEESDHNRRRSRAQGLRHVWSAQQLLHPEYILGQSQRKLRSWAYTSGVGSMKKELSEPQSILSPSQAMLCCSDIFRPCLTSKREARRKLCEGHVHSTGKPEQPRKAQPKADPPKTPQSPPLKGPPKTPLKRLSIPQRPPPPPQSPEGKPTGHPKSPPKKASQKRLPRKAQGSPTTPRPRDPPLPSRPKSVNPGSKT